MPEGELTVRLAQALMGLLSDRDLDVLFDHGDPHADGPDQVGEIVSWFGPHLARSSCFAFLDIAIVRRDSDKAVMLFEIEESSATPKVLLGDLFAALLGDHFTFQGTHHLKVGGWTTLVVLVRARSEKKRQKIAELATRCRRVNSAIRSGNAVIGSVIVDTFANAQDLMIKTEGLVMAALGQ